MTDQHFEQKVSGSATALQAATMHVNYWTGDYVKLSKVASSELAHCSGDDYVHPDGESSPAEGTQVQNAARLLSVYGMVVLVAPPGTGRRTLALRVLATAATFGDVNDLEPQWAGPNADVLPSQLGRFVLDLSNVMDEERTADFNRKLVEYGTKRKDEGRRLVVLLSEQECTSSADEVLQPYVLRVRPPDARALVLKYLQRVKPEHLHALESGEFDEILRSNPSAAEATRLARIIAEADEVKPGDIKDEYTGWTGHIASLLALTGKPKWQNNRLEARAVIWAGALLDGGLTRSVLQAADDFLTAFGITRAPKDIMGGPTSAERLQAAELTAAAGGVAHDRTKHGLPAAILQRLLDEFPTEETKIIDWAASVAAGKTLPEDDARRAAVALLELGLSRGDASIIKTLGTKLAATRQALAVEVLTKAALDPGSGAFTRGLLYNWAASTTQRELVVAVCGGRLGVEKPDIALTRLWRAASLTPNDVEALAVAFKSLISTSPAVVLEALKAWLKEKANDVRTLGVVVAIGSTETGSAFLVRSLAEPIVGDGLRRAWEPLLARTDAAGLVRNLLALWQDLVAQGKLPEEVVLDFLSDVYQPRFKGSDTLYGPNFDLDSFEGQVLTRSLRKDSQRQDDVAAG
jgi:hypothetical protein